MINKKLLMTAIFTIAFVAIAAAAASAAVTVKVDTVQTDGHYVGTPVLLHDEIYHWGYNYTFVPDGTFTVKGTITNDDASNPTTVLVAEGTKAIHLTSLTYDVPAGGKVSFSLTCPSDSDQNIAVGYIWPAPTHESEAWKMVDIPGADYIDAVDTTTHTIDEGPMSDAVAIYANGQLISNAGVIYLINQSSDDYKAMYTSSKLTYSGQPLYTIGLY